MKTISEFLGKIRAGFVKRSLPFIQSCLDFILGPMAPTLTCRSEGKAISGLRAVTGGAQPVFPSGNTGRFVVFGEGLWPGSTRRSRPRARLLLAALPRLLGSCRDHAGLPCSAPGWEARRGAGT